MTVAMVIPIAYRIEAVCSTKVNDMHHVQNRGNYLNDLLTIDDNNITNTQILILTMQRTR